VLNLRRLHLHSFSGDRATPLVTAGGAAVHFRGAAILRAAQAKLLEPAFGLARGTDVVVSGCSGAWRLLVPRRTVWARTARFL
jgi:hypothetical protein